MHDDPNFLPCHFILKIIIIFISKIYIEDGKTWLTYKATLTDLRDGQAICLITVDAMSLSQCKEGNKERMSVSTFMMGVLYCFYVFIRKDNWTSKEAVPGAAIASQLISLKTYNALLCRHTAGWHWGSDWHAVHIFPFLLLKSYPTNCVSRFTCPDCVLGGNSQYVHNSSKNQMIMSSATFRKEEFHSRIRKGRQWWLQGSKLFPNSAALLVTPKFLKVLGNTRPSESTQSLWFISPDYYQSKTWM